MPLCNKTLAQPHGNRRLYRHGVGCGRTLVRREKMRQVDALGNPIGDRRPSKGFHLVSREAVELISVTQYPRRGAHRLVS